MASRSSAGTKARGKAATATVSVVEVCDWLRERIRRGIFAPGQRLVEPDIIAATGASRSRVREALHRLQQEELVVLEEYRGASVRRFSPDDLRQRYVARMALEGMAAGVFAGSDDSDSKDRLGELQEAMNLAEAERDYERFAAMNEEWHRLIVRCAGNQYIQGFVDRLRVPIYRLLQATFHGGTRVERANADHRGITDAILAGDAATAEKLMRAHIEKSAAFLAEIDPIFYS